MNTDRLVKRDDESEVDEIVVPEFVWQNEANYSHQRPYLLLMPEDYRGNSFLHYNTYKHCPTFRWGDRFYPYSLAQTILISIR